MIRTAAVFILMLGIACVSETRRAPPERVTLAFGRSATGAILDVVNTATTRMRTFSARQPTRDRTETVDFTTRTTMGEKYADGVFNARVTTTAKDGHSSLREMAFPELHEVIELTTTARGEVLRAGGYAPSSVFFIPSLPLPAGPVRIGDTWALDHDWTSGVDHFPLRLEIIGVLKDIDFCAGGHVCADVEVSGHVALRVPPDNAGARFDSRVRGRAVFDVDRGDVIWAHVVSREEITLGPEVSVIESCLLSRVAGGPRPTCVPDFADPINVPKF